MTSEDPPIHTTPDDESFRSGARSPDGMLRQPFVIGFLAVAGAAIIFLLGIRVGEAAYLAFDGEGMMAATFGATFLAVLVTIIAVGVLLDRRQRTREANSSGLTDSERDRLRAYVQPASPLVRWYQPATVAVFIALATPGAVLLDTPWDSLWVLAVLIANPLARWLRTQGHVLTTRDLGFPVPALSPWPSIAAAALAATTGMAIAVLLWAEALDTTLATSITGIALAVVIVGGGLAIDRHHRHHILQLLDRQRV